MIFSTTTRLFFEANFENSFSAIAEKNTILVYLCAASARFWWRSRTQIFRKAFISNVPWIWNSTTIHIRSIFQKKFCWLGLAVRISSEWLGKKIAAIKNDDFLTFYWQTLVHFDCYTAMNWPWLSKVPWIFQNPESMRLQKKFPGPVDSNFEIKMLFLSFESKKLLNEVITSRENGLKLRQNWCWLGKNLNFSMFEACMYK